MASMSREVPQNTKAIDPVSPAANPERKATLGEDLLMLNLPFERAVQVLADPSWPQTSVSSRLLHQRSAPTRCSQ